MLAGMPSYNTSHSFDACSSAELKYVGIQLLVQSFQLVSQDVRSDDGMEKKETGPADSQDEYCN
jgi:hypothetical protein